MKDCLGQEIKIGDTILWGRGQSYAGMVKLIVTKINTVKLTAIPKKGLADYERPNVIDPENVVVVTELIQLIKEKKNK